MLRYRFLVWLGILAGVAYAINLVSKATTNESFSQGVGYSFPLAPKMTATGQPGQILDSFHGELSPRPQGISDLSQRYDVVFYQKAARIDFPPGLCKVSIVGPSVGEGYKEITWAPVSLVGDYGSQNLNCYAPRGPVDILTGAREIAWKSSFSKALSGDPAFATATLNADDVKKAIGSPVEEIIEGFYDQKNRPDYCLIPSCWKFNLTKQVDIYSFLNRSGLLKITYDGNGYSTKIENTLEKK